MFPTPLVTSSEIKILEPLYAIVPEGLSGLFEDEPPVVEVNKSAVDGTRMSVVALVW